jgi:arsenate reductase
MPADRVYKVDGVYNVLFLCTGNSARSILGEAVMDRLGGGRFRGFSAGSHPKGTVHPMTLRVLAEAGYPIEGLRSKSWDEFASAGAPKLDFVFTVCDDAAGEACPAWPGQPMTAHWGMEDPAAVEGYEFQRLAAFEDTLRFIRNRITAFASLPLASIDRLSLQARLNAIGRAKGIATLAPPVA